MTEPLTPAQTAAAVKQGIGDFGFTWMADKAGRERGKAELGLRGRSLYHLGRAGVLGDVPVEVVVAAEAFYPPDVVRRAWEEGRALVTPADAARFYGLAAELLDGQGDAEGAAAARAALRAVPGVASAPPPPEISSSRTTMAAGMRLSCSDGMILELGRSPLTRMLPAVAPKPRRSSPSRSSKPGTRATMSAAVTGL